MGFNLKKSLPLSVFSVGALADFDLQTGAVLEPPAQKGVPSYKVVVEGDDIKVEV
jgi:nitrite reductase/ring-hydroxylating ferredoxin subunit